MRKAIAIGTLFFLALIQFNGHTPPPQIATKEIIRNWLTEEIKNSQLQLSQSLNQLDQVIQLKSNYTQARKHYKHVEFFVEYYSPREAKHFINGALVPKVDIEMSSEALAPQGFQRIEELLFKSDLVDTAALRKEYTLLKERLSTLSNYYKQVHVSESQLLEMCQLELFRISAMNLNGYDATITQTNVTESLWCLEGIEKVIQAFEFHATSNDEINRSYKILMNELEKAKNDLLKHPDYNTFNRLHFITTYINKLNALLVRFHTSMKLPWSNNRAMALDLKHGFLFGKENINTAYFSSNYYDSVSIKQQAQLGELLFFDPILSGNNKRSCASCHNPSKAFTDGLSRNKEIESPALLLRNTPTLLNVIYQKAFFYDGRVYELDDQIARVVHSENEMQSSLEDIVSKLRQSSEYRRLFKKAFQKGNDSVITAYTVQKAITEYEKTLQSMNSRFDKYLHGDKSMLKKREIQGYNLFAGKALCGSCHFFPLFNGTVPPYYNDSEFEIIGTPEDASNKILDGDEGRFSVTHINEQRYAFKTPTVRNIEFTGPYMHHGIYTTLEEVIEFYHQGGGAGLKYSVPNQTLPFDSLQLSLREKEDIVLFLKTLSDTLGLTHQPKRLPVFEKNPEWNKRVIGGEY